MSHDRFTDALVERHARWSQLRDAASSEKPTRTPAFGPYITISRQLGAGGCELAHVLAAPIGWKVLDREILRSMADLHNASEDALAARDEQPSRLFDDLLSHLLVPGDMGQSGYLSDLARTVGTFAREGRVVVLGRGANWFLSGKYGLKLRTVAPFEQRVASLARRQGIDEKSARTQVERHDRDQKAFIRQTFNRDIDDPLGYDIVLNLGTISLDQAADLAVAALRRKLGGQD